MSKIQSQIELAKFISGLKNPITMENGNIVFITMITYEWDQNIQAEKLQVTIHRTTIEGGKITLKEGKLLNISNVFIEFNPKYQNYKLSEDGSLIIEGEGIIPPKIWKYKVKINKI